MIEIESSTLGLQNSLPVLNELYFNQTSNCSSTERLIKSFISYDSEISYDTFFRNNLEKNEPCIFGNWLSQKWLARQDWVTSDDNINYKYLTDCFGVAKVPVANCERKYYDSQDKETFTFDTYVQYLRNPIVKECLYLKDWHFVRDFPKYKAYEIPSFFASDWLNEFWDSRSDITDDYKFVYIGPKGSWTPFHADVFRSYSWSSNICGRKRWVLYAPGEEKNMVDHLGNLIYDIEAPEFRDKCRELRNTALEVIQEAGQTIFVPSKWHHQVWNLDLILDQNIWILGQNRMMYRMDEGDNPRIIRLANQEDTISINHNWINATNIMIVWKFLHDSLEEVEKAIEDCSAMEGWAAQCQLILKSTHGMDFHEYFQFLKAIAIRRLKYLKGDVEISSFPTWQLGRNHVIYDIKKLVTCFELLLDDLDSDVLECLDENDHPTSILDQLQAAL